LLRGFIDALEAPSHALGSTDALSVDREGLPPGLVIAILYSLANLALDSRADGQLRVLIL